MSTRQGIFLVGHTSESICGTISCGQLYSTITRRTRQLENRLQLLCERPCHFGQELGYPPDRNITVAKLVSLYEAWRTLLKSKGKKSKFQQAKEEAIKEKLKDLFELN